MISGSVTVGPDRRKPGLGNDAGNSLRQDPSPLSRPGFLLPFLPVRRENALINTFSESPKEPTRTPQIVATDVLLVLTPEKESPVSHGSVGLVIGAYRDVTGQDLSAGYTAMAADAERETEAEVWSEALVTGVRGPSRGRG